VTCPACWPGYAALLSSLGVGFLPTAPYLLPLTLVGLAIPIGVLAVVARGGHGLPPLVLGVIGSILLVVGRFALDSNSLLFLGTMGLVAASLWNAWPRRRRSAGSCPACSVISITKKP
jgi:mercuric ion transport protein